MVLRFTRTLEKVKETVDYSIELDSEYILTNQRAEPQVNADTDKHNYSYNSDGLKVREWKKVARNDKRMKIVPDTFVDHDFNIDESELNNLY